jgi:hypothetical membrane protein
MKPGLSDSIDAAAGWSGIAAFLLAVAGSAALGFMKSGYDPFISTISELGERGAPTAAAAALLFIAIGACEIVFSVGLCLRSRRKKAALWGSMFLIVNGLFDYIGSGLFPVDPGGAYESPSGRIHFLLSVIGMSVTILPAFFYWRAFVAEERKAAGRATLIAAILIALAGIFFNFAFFTGRLVGLAQRALDYLYFAWILFLSIGLVARRRFTTP